MRRFTLTIAASIAALALLPAAALAGARHHQRRHHHVHHAVVRHERFGAATNPTSSGSGSTSSATGTPSPAETAGTVQSFDAGVLTLALPNGTTVSGKVDNGTDIECAMAEVNTDMRADGDGGSANGGGDNSGPGGGGDQGSRGDDNGDDTGNDNQNCTSASLVAGAVVGSAELRISSSGTTWDKVELIG